MNLHEQYAELVRRGMPEHPSVGFKVCWKAEPPKPVYPGRHGPMPDDDARDLITMHALRWYAGENWQNYAGAMVALSGFISGTGQCPLAAILAATEHLGVKG